MNKTAIAYKAH